MGVHAWIVRICGLCMGVTMWQAVRFGLKVASGVCLVLVSNFCLGD
jgi:hypothetical protein